jgi:hypothetical protein
MWDFVVSYIANTSTPGSVYSDALEVSKAVVNVLDEIAFAEACGKELVDLSSIQELQVVVRSAAPNPDMSEEQWIALDLACKTCEVLVYWYLLKPEGAVSDKPIQAD